MNDDCRSYMEGVRKRGLIAHEDLMAMFMALECSEVTEDEKALVRNVIVEGNLRLVISIAKKYGRWHLPLMDLVQEGSVGLMRAVSRFDHKQGFHFSTYATWWIRQAIDQFVVKNRRLVRLPAHAVTVQRRLARALEDSEDGTMSFDELLTATQASHRVLRATMLACHETVSLDASWRDEDGCRILQEVLPDTDVGCDPFEALSSSEVMTEVARALDELSSREAAVLRLRFGLARTSSDELGFVLTDEQADNVRAGGALT
jgi:RNA polymerase sigma factor (sigma-70 family)